MFSSFQIQEYNNIVRRETRIQGILFIGLDEDASNIKFKCFYKKKPFFFTSDSFIMSALTSFSELSPPAKDLIYLLFEYVDCLVDQTLNRYDKYKKQFLLQVRLMEAIEHEYFADADNIQPIQAVYIHQEIEHLETNVEEHTHNSIIKQGQMQLGNGKQQVIEQLLLHLNMEDSEDSEVSDKEDIETKLVELLLLLKLGAPWGDYSEATLIELLSSLELKAPEDGLKQDELPKDELAMAKMAAALAKLSLGVDSPDTFDRDLAVFDRDGNIMVQDLDIFTFLTKALLNQNGEKELLRRLLFPDQNEWDVVDQASAISSYFF